MLMQFVCVDRLTGAGRMLWLLLCLLPLVGCSRLLTQDVPYEDREDHGESLYMNYALFILYSEETRENAFAGLDLVRIIPNSPGQCTKIYVFRKLVNVSMIFKSFSHFVWNYEASYLTQSYISHCRRCY